MLTLRDVHKGVAGEREGQLAVYTKSTLCLHNTTFFAI